MCKAIGWKPLLLGGADFFQTRFDALLELQYFLFCVTALHIVRGM